MEDIKIAEKVRKIIAERLQVDVKEVKDDSSFSEDLGADSLDAVELIMDLEDAFGIPISDEKSEKMKKVSDAIQLIESMVKSEK